MQYTKRLATVALVGVLGVGTAACGAYGDESGNAPGQQQPAGEEPTSDDGGY